MSNERSRVEPSLEEKKEWRSDPVTWRFVHYLDRESQNDAQEAEDTLVPGGSREVGLVKKARADLFMEIRDAIEAGTWMSE